LFLLFSVTVLLYPTAQSEASSVGLSISPQKFDLVVFPGDSDKDSFKLGNRGEISLPVSVRVTSFGAEEGTGDMLLQRPDPEGPESWVRFETSELILEPGETRRLNFEIDVPDDAEPGGYYIFTYFEPRIPSYQLEEMGPEVVPVVGVPFLISTTSLALDAEEKEFEVVEFSIPERERALLFEDVLENIQERFGFFESGIALAETGNGGRNIRTQITRRKPSEFTVSIKNRDLYHIKPEGTLSIYNTFGNKIGEGEFEGQTILPGRTRDFTVFLQEAEAGDSAMLSASLFEVAGEMFFGKYRAELDVKAAGPIRKEVLPRGGNPSIVFFSLASFYFLAGFVIILIVFYLGRRRIKLAFRALTRRRKNNDE